MVSCAFKNRQSSGHVDEVFGTCTNKWADAMQFFLVALWFFYSIILVLESCQLIITLLRFIPSTTCSQENELKNKNRSNLKVISNVESHAIDTGKSLSEALLFAEHGGNMLCTKIVLNVENNFCTQHVLSRFELGIFMY